MLRWQSEGSGAAVVRMSEGSVDKPLLAFLNGLSKRLYFGDTDITDEFLQKEVLGVPEEEYAAVLKKYTTLISTLVSADMDFTQLDAFLSSQMKKRQGALTEGEAATITKFWKLQKSKIHQHLIESTMWGSHLESFSWRIDVKTKARHLDQLNQPTAIMEMKLQSNLEDKSEDQIIRFEMDGKKLSQLLSQVEDIEKSIDMYAHT